MNLQAIKSMWQTLQQQTWVVELAKLLSAMIEERVTPALVLHLLHTQLAVLIAMLPFELPFSAYWVLGVWMTLGAQQAWTSYKAAQKER